MMKITYVVGVENLHLVGIYVCVAPYLRVKKDLHLQGLWGRYRINRNDVDLEVFLRDSALERTVLISA